MVDSHIFSEISIWVSEINQMVILTKIKMIFPFNLVFMIIREHFPQ